MESFGFISQTLCLLGARNVKLNEKENILSLASMLVVDGDCEELVPDLVRALSSAMLLHFRPLTSTIEDRPSVGSDEEFKLSLVSTLKRLLAKYTPASTLESAKGVFAVLLQCLLTAAESETNLKLRTQALECLDALVNVVDNPDILSMVLPGVASGCRRVLISRDFRSSTQIRSAAVSLLRTITVGVCSDARNQTGLAQLEENSQQRQGVESLRKLMTSTVPTAAVVTSATAAVSVPELEQKKEAFLRVALRDHSWIQQTRLHYGALFRDLVECCPFDRSRLMHCLVQMAAGVLQHCGAVLSTSVIPLIELLLLAQHFMATSTNPSAPCSLCNEIFKASTCPSDGRSVQENGSTGKASCRIGSRCRDSLEHFRQGSQPSQWQILDQRLLELIVSLPTKCKSGESPDRAMVLVVGYVHYVFRERISLWLNGYQHLTRLTASLCNVLGLWFSAQEKSSVVYQPCTFATAVLNLPEPHPRGECLYLRRSADPLLSVVTALCSSLGYHSDLSLLTTHWMSTLRDWSRWRVHLQTAFLLNCLLLFSFQNTHFSGNVDGLFAFGVLQLDEYVQLFWETLSEVENLTSVTASSPQRSDSRQSLSDEAFDKSTSVVCSIVLEPVREGSSARANVDSGESYDHLELRHRRSLLQLLLEGMACFAVSLNKAGIESKPRLSQIFLRRTLYLILEKAADHHKTTANECSVQEISETAQTALELVAAAMGYTLPTSDIKTTVGSVSTLLAANSDYIIDAVLQKMKTLLLFPTAPGVLRVTILCMAKEPALGPLAQQGTGLALANATLGSVLEAIDTHRMDRALLNELVRVLDVIVNVLVGPAKVDTIQQADQQRKLNAKLSSRSAQLGNDDDDGVRKDSVRSMEEIERGFRECWRDTKSEKDQPEISEEQETNENEETAIDDSDQIKLLEKRLLVDIAAKARNFVRTSNTFALVNLLSTLKKGLVAFSHMSMSLDEFTAEISILVNAASSLETDSLSASLSFLSPSKLAVFEDMKVYPMLHNLWAPLLHALLPPGYSYFEEIATEMPPLTTPDLTPFGFAMNSIDKNGKRKFLRLPTPPMTSSVHQIVQFLQTMLFHFSQFVSFRFQAELWPTLRYHLYAGIDLSHPSHNGGGGAKGLQYVVGTIAYKIQVAILELVLMTVLIVCEPASGSREASALDERDRQFCQSVFQSVRHFVHKKQPPVLCGVARLIVQRIQTHVPTFKGE